MEISFIRKSGPEYITGALRATTGKNQKVIKNPSIELWEKLLYSAGGVPHSPIRAVEYRFFVKNVPSFVATHFSRHHVGSQPYIKSQRDDRNENRIPRHELPQDELISMILDVNVNALINMGKARLCRQADPEAIKVMKGIKKELENGDDYDKALAKYLIPPCKWYRICFEPNPCSLKKGNIK